MMQAASTREGRSSSGTLHIQRQLIINQFFHVFILRCTSSLLGTERGGAVERLKTETVSIVFLPDLLRDFNDVIQTHSNRTSNRRCDHCAELPANEPGALTFLRSLKIVCVYVVFERMTTKRANIRWRSWPTSASSHECYRFRFSASSSLLSPSLRLLANTIRSKIERFLWRRLWK